jgi:hypothetical protein
MRASTQMRVNQPVASSSGLRLHRIHAQFPPIVKKSIDSLSSAQEHYLISVYKLVLMQQYVEAQLGLGQLHRLFVPSTIKAVLHGHGRCLTMNDFWP